MKKKYLLLSLLFLTLDLSAQLDTIVVNKNYELSRKFPLIAGSGTVVITHADSIYLFNKIRFEHYQELRQLVRDSIGEEIEDIVLKYEKILTENDMLFAQLEKKCREQSELYEESIVELKKSLNNLDVNLDLTHRSLENANKSLELGLEQIKQSQKKRTWQNIGILGGGICLGLITGLLLAN